MQESIEEMELSCSMTIGENLVGLKMVRPLRVKTRKNGVLMRIRIIKIVLDLCIESVPNNKIKKT